MKNNHVPDISRTLYQSNKIINSPPQSRKTIPLMSLTNFLFNTAFNGTINFYAIRLLYVRENKIKV
jgi:hypothetical protein